MQDLPISRGRCARRAAVVLLLAVAVVSGGCASGAAEGDLAALAALVPAELAERGLLLQSGSAGSELLVAALGIEAAAVTATATTGAPAVRLVALRDPTAGADAMAAAGFEVAAAAPEGWRILTRPVGGAVDEGFAGVPAVAIGPSVAVVGTLAELQAVASADPPIILPDGALGDAAIALVVPGSVLRGGTASAVTTGALPPIAAVVLTADATGEAGVLALQLPEEGTQEDAVGLAVRVRTAGPVDEGGQALLQPDAPLTDGAVVRLQVAWEGDAEQVLRSGLATGLLDFLGDG